MDVPAPRGRYTVGRSEFVLVDSSRADPWAPATEPQRTILVKAWYPAASSPGAGAPASRAPYAASVGSLPGDFSLGERWVAKHLASHAFLNLLPVAETRDGERAAAGDHRPRWPMIVFSPGANMLPEYYASLLEDLASAGYMVVAFDHLHEGNGQRLPDGRSVPPDAERERPPAGTPCGAMAFYRKRVGARVADESFAIARLIRGDATIPPALLADVDTTRIGALGHSLGGVAAMELCRTDSHVRACLNLDGLAGGRPTVADSTAAPFRAPVAYVGKPIAATIGTRAIEHAIAEGEAGGYVITIDGTSHESFSDEAYFRPTLHPVHARSVTATVREVVTAFFDDALSRAGAARHELGLKVPATRAGVHVVTVSPASSAVRRTRRTPG